MTSIPSGRNSRWLFDIARDPAFREGFAVGALIGFAFFAWLLIDG